MKKLIILSMLVLAGCADPIMSYSPILADQPKNQEKYQDDLVYCREWSHPTPEERTTIGLTSVVGMIALSASGDDRVWKSGKTLVNECMIKKGYKLQET